MVRLPSLGSKHLCLFCLLVLLTSTLELLYFREKLINRWWHGQKNVTESARFREDWCRMQNWRIDWKQILLPCVDQMAWDKRQANSHQRTDAKTSYVTGWDIRPAGQFSRFFIQSVTSSGKLKIVGGDSWRIYIRVGPSSLAPVVFDLNNGLYEVLFLVLEPGSYTAQVWLDYTLCDGFRDPPENWFRKGNVQGREQKHGMLGYIGDDYILQPLQQEKPIKFDVTSSPTNDKGLYRFLQETQDVTCGQRCPMLWNGLGRWVNGQWLLHNEEIGFVQQIDPRKMSKLETLMVYGDSVSNHYHALGQLMPLCKEIFKRCKKTYMWIYDANWEWNDDKDFNQTIILDVIEKILTRPDMMNSKSVFLFNIGIHYSISINFTTYQKLIDSVISLLQARKSQGTGQESPVFPSRPVWRSSTAIERELAGRYYGGHNFTSFRFHTSPRIELFHHYAMNVMCQAGIPTLDMYPLTAAWPLGTFNGDHIHYPNEAMIPSVEVLEKYVKRIFGEGAN